jgi:hypothetical protein
MGACFCRYQNNSDYVRVDDIKGSTKITIDGITYTLNSIKTLYNEDGNICADGKVIIHTDSMSSFNIDIVGNVGNVSVRSGKINIEGPVSGHVESSSGGVNVSGSIGGNVNATSGDVNVHGNIKGRVTTTSGDVKAGSIMR